jgi:iron(III) transport system ATP-binding protein
VTVHGAQAEEFNAPGRAAPPGAAQAVPVAKRASPARAAYEAGGPVSLRLQEIHKLFGACRAVDGISLDVREGELLAILGPSGCGKSTLLRIIAGLERQDSGRVTLHGRDVSALPPAARGCGVVFQSYALFPNLTAAANVAFGIDRRRHGRVARAERARALLDQVGLADAATRYPAQLSGGQQQRVALARALATEPGLLLLDEPLSALDAKVRASLRVEIRRLQQATRLTTLLVTHDQEEAMTMADRVAVMNEGRLVQVDEPRGVYQRPADAFTAAFVGVMNRLDGWKAAPGRSVQRGALVLQTTEEIPFAPGSFVTVSFRPEDAALEAAVGPETSGLGGRENVLPCVVERVEFRGPFVRHYVALAGRDREPLLAEEIVLVDVPARDAAALNARPGAGALLRVPAEGIQIFRDERSAL